MDTQKINVFAQISEETKIKLKAKLLIIGLSYIREKDEIMATPGIQDKFDTFISDMCTKHFVMPTSQHEDSMKIRLSIFLLRPSDSELAKMIL